MVTRNGGFRRKTRSKLKKHFRDKGKLSIRKFLQTFQAGERAILSAEPSIKKATPEEREFLAGPDSSF